MAICDFKVFQLFIMQVLIVFLWTLFLVAAESPVRDSRCPLNEDSMNPTHLPYTNDCTKFYKCSAGFAFPVNCPLGLHWSVRLNRCEYPSVAGCDGSIAVSVLPEEKGIPMAACPPAEDPNTPTQLPFPGDCGKFYKCSAGYGFPINCPQGLHWSTALNRCDWPSVANCASGALPSDPTTNPTTPTASPPPNSNLQCPIVDDLSNPAQFPFPGDCTKYYKCLSGIAYPISCPAGLQWSTTLNRCDWPSVANCARVSPTTTTTTTTTAKPTTTSAPSPAVQCPATDDVNNPVQFPFPGECGKFYKCLNGIAQAVNCPAGLHWSTTLNRCDWPSVANCVSVSPTTTTTTTTTTAKPTTTSTPSPAVQCPATDDVNNPVQFPIPGECGKFYKCLNGIAQVVNCPTGLHWSTALNRCDWPSLANCANKVITTTTTTTQPTTTSTTSTSTTPSSSFIELNPDAYCSQSTLIGKRGSFPYPGDSHKFILCYNGRGQAYSCVSGMFFNPKLEVCSTDRSNVN